jgi:bifunctional DNA-binding transcriptional regulator/antitoxin component of YhaV-PrlF toxin-antitoxin module
MKAERIIKPFGSGQITIPVEFRRRLSIDRDTLLKVTLREESIEIEPLRIGEGESAGRDYSLEEIERFITEDKLDPVIAAKVKKLLG